LKSRYRSSRRPYRRLRCSKAGPGNGTAFSAVAPPRLSRTTSPSPNRTFVQSVWQTLNAGWTFHTRTVTASSNLCLFRIDAFDVLLPDFTARRHLAVPHQDVGCPNGQAQGSPTRIGFSHRARSSPACRECLIGLAAARWELPWSPRLPRPVKKPGLLASLERIVAQVITVTSIGSKAHSLANFQRGRRTGP
jgi:hypothetical protein